MGEDMTGIYEGVYVAHWEVARFAVVRGRRWFGRGPKVEKWRPCFPDDFELPHVIGRDRGRFYRMRVRGSLGPEGHFGHKGICSRELFVDEVLSVEETDDPGPTW